MSDNADNYKGLKSEIKKTLTAYYCSSVDKLRL